MANPVWDNIERLVDEIVDDQRKKLLHCGRRLIPTLTSEDVLQPNDYPELEHHPHFRYEEGILAGLQTLQTALRAMRHESELTKKPLGG